jgi:hypothetical protein
MQKMQKCHGQAQEFDNFPAILHGRGYANGSTPKLFGSGAAIEHVAFSGK